MEKRNETGPESTVIQDDLPNETTQISEASENAGHNEISEKNERRELLKKTSLLLFVVLTALLAVLCIVLFISTLPGSTYAQQAGIYSFSHAQTGDSTISADETDLSITLRLSDNGWCRLIFGDKTHYGRWKSSDNSISLYFGDSSIDAEAIDKDIKLINPLGRGMDLFLTRAE